MRYYWCTNCGSVGDFGFDRQRGLGCGHCSYGALTELSGAEWRAEPTVKKIGSRAFKTYRHWVKSKYLVGEAETGLEAKKSEISSRSSKLATMRSISASSQVNNPKIEAKNSKLDNQ